MDLSAPAPRRKLHHRAINLEGFEREDGLFEVEAELIDTKTYAYTAAARGHLEAGTPVHHMRVRVTFDDRMKITAAEAVTLAGPWGDCPSGGDKFHRLVGLTLGPGFTAAVKERIGGAAGCTHHRELLQQVATVAFQTSFRRSLDRIERDIAAGTIKRHPRERLVNTCRAYAEGGAALAQLRSTGGSLPSPDALPNAVTNDVTNDVTNAAPGSSAGDA